MVFSMWFVPEVISCNNRGIVRRGVFCWILPEAISRGLVAQLHGRDIPFGNNVTYLGDTIDRAMTWRHHIEKTVPKDLRTYIRTYYLFKSRSLSTNIKLTFYKTLIRSIMIYANPTWKYATDADLLQLQCLQDRVLCATGKLDRCT
jgi:hypothetical protein